MGKLYIYVDGNYLFFQAKSLGLPQDFGKLVTGIQRLVGESEEGPKRFYTRPPNNDGSKPVIGWLKAHGWEATLFRYDGTGQDAIYTKLIPDLMADVFEELPASLCVSEDIPKFVIVSGSGNLSFPFEKLRDAALGGACQFYLAGTESSTNAKLLNLDYLTPLPLEDILRG